MYNLNMLNRKANKLLIVKYKLRSLRNNVLDFLLIMILLTLNSYPSQKEFKRSFLAWGTNLDFVILSELNEQQVNKAILEAQKIVLDKNVIFNNYDKNSEISKFNLLSSNIEREISDDFSKLFEMSIKYNIYGQL